MPRLSLPHAVMTLYRRIGAPLFGATIFVLLVTVAVLGFRALPKPLPPPDYPTLGGDFALQSTRGPVALSDFAGQVIVLTFGYGHCPDICRTTLTSVANAFQELNGDEMRHVQGLFVSLDPERDGPAEIGAFAAQFHEKILGLSGSASEIAEIAKQYAIGYEKDAPSSPSDYNVTHSTYMFVVRPDGRIGTLLSHHPPQEIVLAVRRWLPWAEPRAAS
jgi:protein SCO1/2